MFYLLLLSHIFSKYLQLCFTLSQRGLHFSFFFFFNSWEYIFIYYMAVFCDICSLRLVFLVTSFFAGSLPGDLGHFFF